MLICVRNMELTYELHKAIKLNFINARSSAVVVRRVSKHFTWHMSSRPYWNSDVRADSAFWYKPTASCDKMFATPPYVMRGCERPFYKSTGVDFSDRCTCDRPTVQRVTEGRLRRGGYVARPNIQYVEPLNDHNFLWQLSP